VFSRYEPGTINSSCSRRRPTWRETFFVAASVVRATRRLGNALRRAAQGWRRTAWIVRTTATDVAIPAATRGGCRTRQAQRRSSVRLSVGTRHADLGHRSPTRIAPVRRRRPTGTETPPEGQERNAAPVTARPPEGLTRRYVPRLARSMIKGGPGVAGTGPVGCPIRHPSGGGRGLRARKDRDRCESGSCDVHSPLG
jgi:hypothetical protein